ncbi:MULTISPECIES: hypothetical protein [Wolbachia]|uniref:Jg24841 protein n=1 Tax=Pararge aegeria aegeria TaxID=348720 RepID=A0A8S4QLS3_9NEOP|nr:MULTISPECIES: hypothetical protein [Wolbachia]UXX40044.1 hypothetical protein MJ631_06020 [Wolbachia endosymbiont of Oryzaephilus surinamensis]BDG76095.1 hypothetical protein wHmt_06530 [Wolbachia pipientis]BDG77555.1 hypothetical protein wHmc_06870 [Wolbachia pipientis]CAH2209346.1 jg24841 [Pararge aegeria aegeria]
MSNNSKQESENNFEVINQMSDFNFKEIDNIEVEVKPTNFEDIADKIATIHYVYQVMDKLVYDLNEKFVSDLNASLMNNIAQLRKESLDINQRLAKGLSHLNELIQQDGFIDNNKNYRTWAEELDHLRGEVEGLKAAIIDHNNVEWEAPTHSDILW